MFYKSIKNSASQFLDNYKSENPATFAAAQQAIGGLLILDGFVGIDNPLGGKKRSGIVGSLVGVIVGLILLFGTNFVTGLFGINKLTAVTTATVTSVTNQSSADTTNSNSSEACTPQATYTVDGKQYTQTASMGSSSACSLTQGQTININYDPSNPGAWAYDLNTVKTVVKIFPIAGAIIAITSLVTFAIRLFSIIFGWKLLRSGRALAKTLPVGTDLSTIKNEIGQNFARSVFSATGFSQVPAQSVPAPVPPSDGPTTP